MNLEPSSRKTSYIYSPASVVRFPSLSATTKVNTSAGSTSLVSSRTFPASLRTNTFSAVISSSGVTAIAQTLASASNFASTSTAVGTVGTHSAYILNDSLTIVSLKSNGTVSASSANQPRNTNPVLVGAVGTTTLFPSKITCFVIVINSSDS